MEENGIKTLQIIDDAKEFITSKKVFFNELLEDQSIFDGQKSKM
jgi:predicted RNA-binding protein